MYNTKCPNYWVWPSTSHYATYPEYWYSSINCLDIASTPCTSSIVLSKHFTSLPYTLPGISYTGSICVRVFHHYCVCVLSTRRHPAHPASVPILHARETAYKLCGHETTTERYNIALQRSSEYQCQSLVLSKRLASTSHFE